MAAKKAKSAFANGLMLTLTVALASCAGGFSHKRAAHKPVPGEIVTQAKFKEGKAYGTASERVVRSAFDTVPRGGGRAVIGKPYKVNGKWYKPQHQPDYNKSGIASWYGPNFHGRKTANGEIYDQTYLSAAHPTLPLPSYVRVTNLANNRSVIVRVNDRGPFHDDRIIDLSYRTAELLGTRAGGLARVNVKYIGSAPVEGDDEKYLLASYEGPGSVYASETAARDKLFAYAGLPSGQARSETVVAVLPDAGVPVPVLRPGSSPVLVANTVTDNTVQAGQPAGAPTIVASNAVFAPAGNGFGLSGAAAVSGEPYVLQPKFLFPVSVEVPVPVPAARRAFRADALDERRNASAYAPENGDNPRIAQIFDRLIDDRASFREFDEPRTIAVGVFTDREKALAIKDELARFGEVSLSAETWNGLPATRIELQTRLPFALNAARKVVSGVVLAD